MHASCHWLTRSGAFVLCLLCGVGVAIVLIEALRYDHRAGSAFRAIVSAPLAERLQQPFPRLMDDTHGKRLVISRPPQRIVSQTLGTDEILLAICDPQRIVALSPLADDATYSNVTAQARGIVGRANAGAEQILHFHPDLVFVASYSKAELVALLTMAQAPVWRFTDFDHLDDIKMNIRLIGYLIGEDHHAETLVQSMEHTIAQVRARIPRDAPPVRVMLYDLSGYTGGTHTTFDDMVRVVGATNVAAVHGIKGFRKISREQLLQWNPDVIITSADLGVAAETRHQLLQDPAIAVTRAGQQQRVIVLQSSFFLTVTHHIVRGIEQLAHELYRLRS
jgi:iron complex transport system substrate-binding protein